MITLSAKKTVVSWKRAFSTKHLCFATLCDKQKDCSSPPKGVSVSHPQRRASRVFIRLAPRLLIVCSKVILSQKSQRGSLPSYALEYSAERVHLNRCSYHLAGMDTVLSECT